MLSLSIYIFELLLSAKQVYYSLLLKEINTHIYIYLKSRLSVCLIINKIER